MGSIFRVPVAWQLDPAALVARLKQAGIQTVATVSDGGTPLAKARFADDGVAVIMGSEYWGLPEALLAEIDLQVTIPMAAGIDSLSINAAAAVTLYQIRYPA